MQYEKISFLSGLFAVLVLLAISASSSAAQDVDISGMDDAQLLMLLQAIMQKMNTSEESAAGTSAAAAAEPVRHSIWKNKKLSVEALPDYMFIRQPEEDESVPRKENNNIKKISAMILFLWMNLNAFPVNIGNVQLPVTAAAPGRRDKARAYLRSGINLLKG